MDKSFSQNFVQYHGCGCFYKDGTLPILNINKKYIKPTINPFWKRPNDVINKVETRSQLKKKNFIEESYVKRYFKYINAIEKSGTFLKNLELLSSDNKSNDESDDESDSEENLIIKHSDDDNNNSGDTKQSPDNKNVTNM